MFTLFIEDDQGQRREVQFSSPGITIGRAKDAEVCLDERNVSRKHARLETSNGGLYLEDLDSYNGVSINGDKINGRKALYAGDRIQVGDFQLQIQGDELQPRPEEITQKTTLPGRDGEEITKTEPVQVPAGATAAAATAATSEAKRPSGSRHDETAIIRLNQPPAASATGEGSVIAGPHPKLFCVKGPLAGRDWPIKKTEVVIGRDEECDISIDHRSISRTHAKIVMQDGRYQVVDLGSSNGTLVNGEPYAQVDLKPGDIIELGHVKFRLMWPGETMPGVTRSISDDEDTRPRVASHSAFRPWIIVFGAATILAAIFVLFVLLMQDKSAQPVVKNQHPEANQPTAPAVVATPPPTQPAPSEPPPPAAQPAAEDQITGALNLAKQQMAREQWDMAIQTLRTAMQAAPNDSQLNAALETAQIERGAKATMDGAMAALSRGDYATARELFNQIADFSIYRQRALKRIAEIDARTSGKHSPTHVAKNKVNPPNPPPPTNPPDEAADKASASSSPREQAQQRTQQGSKAYKAGKYQEAVELFQQAIKSDPKYPPAHRNLGVTYAKMGNSDAAVEQYKIYLRLDPDAEDAEQVKKLVEMYESNGG